MRVADVPDKMLQDKRYIGYAMPSDVLAAISFGATGENGLGGRRLTSAA